MFSRRPSSEKLLLRNASSRTPAIFFGQHYPGGTSVKENPNGIPAFSPGLRGTSYPGCAMLFTFDSTLKGLHDKLLTAATMSCCNPFRVDGFCGIAPRVARSSQPWAEGHNPFRIGMCVRSGRLPLHSRHCSSSHRFRSCSSFGLLSDFGSRISDFSRTNAFSRTTLLLRS